MNIDWTHFSPWSALAGGALIGLASSLFLLSRGRIAGIAGILAGPLRVLLVRRLVHEGLAAQGPRLLFLLGLLMAPWVWRLFAIYPEARLDVGLPALALAGLLVGVGVSMANGCTSGHGVCGLSRLSLRSLANVLAFMGAGFATVFVLRHMI
jgi:uncharacterized protein